MFARIALAALVVAAMPTCSERGGTPVNGDGDSPSPAAGDAASITEQLIRSHITVIAHDSMRGRRTPSAGLDRTGEYIAGHFASLKLKPGGDDGSFIQRYGVPMQPETRAPNVVAILEGSDPALKGQYVVFSAHMDHVGVGAPVAGDSIYNGADDNASGTAAVLALANAFANSSARPRRSLIFLTVSGEEEGLWGSAYFATHPPVPLDSMVAALNIDMIGRNWRDTVVAIGREHSDLGATLDSVAMKHRELGMTPIDDPWPNERFYFRSDHYNFARRGVPVLFFFSGVHDDYHGPNDEAERIDVEKETRIVRLLYHFGLELANAEKRPEWNAESYRRIVGQK